MHVTLRKTLQTESELEVEIPSPDFELYVDKAAEKLSQNLEVQGFRKGHVPKNIVERELGNSALYGEAAEVAVRATYEKACKELPFSSFRAKAVSEVQVMKLAAQNPFVYKIVFTLPTFELAEDYRAIARKARERERKEVVSEEKEVDDALHWLAKSRKSKDAANTSSQPSLLKEEAAELLDDDFAKSLGNFQNLEELKKSVREGITLKKQNKEKERIRLAIIKEIIARSKREIPEKVVLAEIARMEEEFKQRISQMGLDYDEYLEKIQKKSQELHEGWREQAKERAEISLCVDAIAEKENINPADEEVQAETQKVLNVYKKAQDAQQNIEPDRLRAYVRGIIRNEKVFAFLEKV